MLSLECTYLTKKYSHLQKHSSLQKNELEITDLLKFYLNKNKLNYEILGRGNSWFDAGKHVTLLSASQFIKAVEDRQGFKIDALKKYLI